MSDITASIAEIKARAAEAFADDQPMCACPYPVDSDARTVWMSEYVALSNKAWGRVAA